MLKIGEFSKLARISIRMLRHYDDLSLLVPNHIDPFTGYRFYSEAQLPIANRISALKDMGFSLSSISSILDHYNDPQALQEFLRVKQVELKEQESELQRRMLLLDTTINRLRKDDTTMKYNVTLKEFPARFVASVRKVIPAYDQEGMLWQTLMSETAPLGLQYGDPCYSLAIFHDEEYKENDVDVEIQITVQGSYENTQNVTFKTTEPMLIASAIYKGSYELITEVNEVVANWVLDNHYVFDGPSFCIYHVSPNQTQNPEELVTEVCFPVRKK